MSMPHKDLRRAPRYKGKPKKLLDFFDKFEEYADTAQLDNEERARWVVKYVEPREERAFWKSMDEYTAKLKDYAALKEVILDQYPGSRKRCHYTHKVLERLVEETADKSMKTEDRLVKYYEKFQPMAMSLISEGKISENDMNTHFWNGIPDPIQSCILKRVRKTDSNQDCRSVPAVEVVLQAGKYVLSHRNSLRAHHHPFPSKKGRRRNGEDADSSDEESSGGEESNEESEAEEVHRRSKATGHGRVESASSTGATKATSLDQLEDLTIKLYQLNVTDMRYAETYFKICAMLPASATSFLTPPAPSLPQQYVSLTNRAIEQAHIPPMSTTQFLQVTEYLSPYATSFATREVDPPVIRMEGEIHVRTVNPGDPSDRRETQTEPTSAYEPYFKTETPRQDMRDDADETPWDASRKLDMLEEVEIKETGQRDREETVPTKQAMQQDSEYEETMPNREEVKESKIDNIEWSAAADLETLHEAAMTTERMTMTESTTTESTEKERSQVSQEIQASTETRADSRIEAHRKLEHRHREEIQEKANIEDYDSPATSTVYARAYSLYQNPQIVANCFTTIEIPTASTAARKKVEVFERSSIETLRPVV